MDEFQYFTTLSMANMTAELRKYHVGLILANQFLDQLEPEIRDAVLGNVGTLVSFRLGPKDASLIAKEFDPTFEPTDLQSLQVSVSKGRNFSACSKIVPDPTKGSMRVEGDAW